MSSSHREGGPRSSITLDRHMRCSASTTRRPSPRIEDGEGVVAPRSVTDSTEQWVWCLCTCVLCCIPICETRLIACKNRSLINSFIVVYYKRFTSLTVCFFSVCSLFDLNSRGCAMARLLHACFGNYGNAWINFIFQGMEEHSLGDEDHWKVDPVPTNLLLIQRHWRRTSWDPSLGVDLVNM